MAATLLEAGKRSWKMPRFVASLTLTAHEKQSGQEPRPTTATELSAVIKAGGYLILFGEGGIGKTTFLLDLSTTCIEDGHRIPLYVDAAVWARANVSLFEYLANRPPAQENGVTSTDLFILAKAGHVAIMLNGWNEMAAASKLFCREDIIQVIATAKALSVVVVSRTSGDTPDLPNAKQIEVRGLTWEGQSAVIRAELDNETAAPLLEILAKNMRLRHAARSPLILRGLIAQARKGAVADASMFDLLGAAVQAFEEDDQRHLVLCVAPVEGHQRAYLEELACLLTQRRATHCSRDHALQAFHSAATQLAKHQLIGVLPPLTSVLDVLVSHHLLHFDDGVIRFAHQRFQEYFAAIRLLRECSEDGVLPAQLRTVINQPAWGESLVLVAGKLKGEAALAAARIRMVKAAAALDLGLACDLIGICALNVVDDSEFHHHLVVRVNALVASPLQEVRDLGIAYQIASGLSVFADNLWALLESEDQQMRLHTYHLNGSAISLVQLGAGAERRIAAWPSERRVESVHGMADNADNYEYLMGLARSEPDLAVRAAAISALFWHFPASDVPLQAWLDAPIDVQIEHNVLSYIRYALDEGHAGEAVREHLRTIDINKLSTNARRQLTLTFPNEVGPRALDVVFEHLGTSERHRNDAPLIAIARTHAPERLLDLAQELALHARVIPDWVDEYLQAAPADIRTDIFEKAWNTLQGQDFDTLQGEILGPLANRNQIERSVAFWLQYAESGRESLTEIDHERRRRLGYLLAHASGDDLLNVVMQRSLAASYNEAARLVDLVRQRIGRDGSSTTNHWLPTLDDVTHLVAHFSEKAEITEVPQHTVRVYLCSIASHVVPAQFGSLLLETCRHHLDAWSTFRERCNERSKKATSSQPQHPQWGHYLASALSKWGPEALPGLLDLMSHPSAMEFIPEAIARSVNLPWTSKREPLINSVSTDIQKGEQRRRLRRELRQPDDTFQRWTDEAAKVLGEKLSELVTVNQEMKSTDVQWDARKAGHRVGRLAGVVASIPSPCIVEPVYRALASGLMEVYGSVETLRGLVRQGLYINDQSVVRQLEALCEQAANSMWPDDSSRYAMSELCALLTCVVPLSLLSKPIGQYLQQWCQFSSTHEVIHQLGTAHTESAWSCLLELGRELVGKGQPREELTPAVVSALTPRNLNEFFALVADGTLLTWCSSAWSLERLAPSVAAVLDKAPDQVEVFVDACRQAKSPLADALAGKVLSKIKGSQEILELFLLEALDAGRAVHKNMPAYRMLRGMFTLEIPISETEFKITPKASNELRAQLYARARGVGLIADSCRCLLASLECGRRETGRADDEPRHPVPEDSLVWTDALVPL